MEFVVALNPCVKQIVCSLSAAVLGALDSAIQLQIANLTVQKNVIEAQILKYDVLGIPIQFANEAAQYALNQLRGFAALIPTNLVAGCADMGNININVQRSIDTVSGGLADITQDATRLLSVREELAFLDQQYSEAISQFNQFRAVIAECALTAI
jgi:hypothetical protein